MRIIIPGIPISQARMRHSTFRGFTRTWDPKSQEKKKIRRFLSSFPGSGEFDYPQISFLFHMPIPKSIRKKDKELFHSGTLKHDKKPDVDNLIKLYLDCLDGIVIHGDQKVSLGMAVKIYHPEPKTIIWIQETPSTLGKQEIAFLDAGELGKQTFFEMACHCGF